MFRLLLSSQKSMSIFKVCHVDSMQVFVCMSLLHHLIPINWNHSFPVTDLETTDQVLDFRVTVLEENGGGDGNSSVAELEVRVETLEGTAADHATRISTAEANITGNNNTDSIEN